MNTLTKNPFEEKGRRDQPDTKCDINLFATITNTCLDQAQVAIFAHQTKA